MAKSRSEPPATALGAQLLGFAALVALVVVSTLSVAHVVSLKRALDGETHFEAVGVATDLATLRDGAEALDPGELQRALERFVRHSSDVAYVRVTDARAPDRVLAAVPLEGKLAPMIDVGTERDAGLEYAVEAKLLRDGACGAKAGEWIVHASALVKARDGAPLATVGVGVRPQRMEALVARSFPLALGASLLAFVVAVLVGQRLARRITRPIEALTARMGDVAKGELGPPADTTEGPREVRALASSYNVMLEGLRQKLALERYVPSLARDGLRNDSGEAVIEARECFAAVLFADLRGFSTLSEKRSPRDVLDLLNVYADAMAKVVADHQGDVIELMGDGILAVFPETSGGFVRVVRCALAMQAELSTLALPELRMGIGIHAGEVVLGTVGTGERLKYTVVGDAVNVSSRIQEHARDPSRSCVMASRAIFDLTKDDVPWVPRGSVPIRGRDGTIELFEVERARDDRHEEHLPPHDGS
jgi:class 3 adenylate cyclase/membrane protein implicated in regulation of membrane protease activity